MADRRWTVGVIALLLALSPQPLALSAQGPSPRAQAAFDGARAYDHLRQIVSIGPRPAGSPALERTREYIIGQLKVQGIAVTQQSFEQKTPIGQIHMVNLVAVIPGARKERIAITGHYDTKLFREVRFVGANDGGSSAAFLIEMARALKARRNSYTVELIFFDGEEATLPDWGTTDHTYGSQYYVDAAKKSGTLSSLKAMILVDMIGEPSPRFLKEGHSTPWLTDAVWSAARKLGHGSVFVDELTPIEDDHLPFLNAGIPSTDIIDLDYSAWHTQSDTLDKTSARSLEIVGNVLLAALPSIESTLGGK